jgi:hypothetical protein
MDKIDYTPSGTAMAWESMMKNIVAQTDIYTSQVDLATSASKAGLDAGLEGAHFQESSIEDQAGQMRTQGISQLAGGIGSGVITLGSGALSFKYSNSLEDVDELTPQSEPIQATLSTPVEANSNPSPSGALPEASKEEAVEVHVDGSAAASESVKPAVVHEEAVEAQVDSSDKTLTSNKASNQIVKEKQTTAEGIKKSAIRKSNAYKENMADLYNKAGPAIGQALSGISQGLGSTISASIKEDEAKQTLAQQQLQSSKEVLQATIQQSQQMENAAESAAQQTQSTLSAIMSANTFRG